MFKQKKSVYRLVAGVITVGLVVLVWRLVISKPKQSTPPTTATATSVELAAPLAVKTITQQISLPLAEAKKDGEVVPNLIFAIESAEVRKQILVKGQTQTAVAGRAFLIFNLKLTNELQKGLDINTRDYVRLVVNGAPDQLAPDIHNDPVEVQAISTKYTRLGFPINETDKSFIIRLGDVKSDKVEIPLEF